MSWNKKLWMLMSEDEDSPPSEMFSSRPLIIKSEGFPVGVIQNWNPSERDLTLNHVYELRGRFQYITAIDDLHGFLMNNINKTIWMHLDDGTEETVPWSSQTQNPCSEIPLSENYRFQFPNLRRVDMSIPPAFYIIDSIQPTSQITGQRFDLIDRAGRLSESIQFEGGSTLNTLLREQGLPSEEMMAIQREEDERVYRILDNLVREGSFALVRPPVTVPPLNEENSVAITNEELQMPIGTHYTDSYD